MKISAYIYTYTHTMYLRKYYDSQYGKLHYLYEKKHNLRKKIIQILYIYFKDFKIHRYYYHHHHYRCRSHHFHRHYLGLLFVETLLDRMV